MALQYPLDKDEVVTVRTEFSTEETYRRALQEIVQASQPIKDNPNCRYILEIAEGALKKGSDHGNGRR